MMADVGSFVVSRSATTVSMTVSTFWKMKETRCVAPKNGYRSPVIAILSKIISLMEQTETSEQEWA